MSRKSMVRVIAVLLAVLLAGSAIFAVFFSALAEDAPRNRYEMQIEVLERLDAVRVDQTLTYRNETGGRLSSVVFNLYPNAFRRQSTAPFEYEAMDSAYPDGFAPGGADFFLIEVDGRQADWGVMGESEAFLRVACELAPGQSAQFRFGYELLLPRCLGVLGVSELGYKLNWFYPIAAPWDEALGEFSVSMVSPVGRNVYADPADYEVTLSCAPGISLASVGAVQSREQQERRIYTIEAKGVRELPISLSQQYHPALRQGQDGIALSAYMRDGGTATFALDVAQRAIDLFGSQLGDYPLQTLTLVEADLMDASAVFSGMVRLNPALLPWDSRDALEYQVVRGVARQWFGEAVGANPAREPWLLEATSSYLALCYYRAVYGEARFLQELNRRALPALLSTYPGGVRVDSEQIQFASISDYWAVVSERGTASIYELSHSLGADGLLAAFRTYMDQNRGRIASVGDFAAALNQISGREMGHLLMDVLQNIEDYAYAGMDWYE